MTRLLILGTLGLFLTFQSAPSTAVRLGPTGNHLTSGDLDQINRLDVGGRAAWVLEGQARGGIRSNSWYVVAYLTADQTRAGIRRGRLAVLKAEMTSPDAYDGPKRWELVSMGDYAQVPLSGADPDALTGSRDLNRPFTVVGTVEDDSLVAIVSLIRTGPAIAIEFQDKTGPPPTGMFRRVEKSWPIKSLLMLSADAVEVSLLDPSRMEKSGQKVWLRKYGTSWNVTRLAAWFAD
jgi:hypothetical protein